MKLSDLTKGNENLIINEKQQRKISKILKIAIDYPNCDHDWREINRIGYTQSGIFSHVGVIIFYTCDLCGEHKKEYV